MSGSVGVARALTNYTYDVVGRLLRAKTGTASDYRYTYDGVGNRLTQDVNGAVTTYAYNAADELTSAGSTTFTYDANGNQTGSSAGQSLSYNAALQTTSITPPGGGATAMTYAGSGQASRVSAAGTSYVYDLRGMASETTSGTTTRYVRDPSGTLLGERIGSTTYYYVFDGLGSVIGLTGSSGSLVATYAYDPYGNLVSSTGATPNRYRFAGGYQDATTGLYKLGERYYDPVLGRWTQPAPEPASEANPAIASAFTYVGGDPVNKVDPSGAYKVPMIKQRNPSQGRSSPRVQGGCSWSWWPPAETCIFRFNRSVTFGLTQGIWAFAFLSAFFAGPHVVLCVAAVAGVEQPCRALPRATTTTGIASACTSA